MWVEYWGGGGRKGMLPSPCKIIGGRGAGPPAPSPLSSYAYAEHKTGIPKFDKSADGHISCSFDSRSTGQ